VVQALLERGWPRVRCLVRPSSHRQRLAAARAGAATGAAAPADRCEFVTGDLLDREDCRRAVDGVGLIYHLAAGIEKSFAGAFMNSALATRNLLEAALETGTLRRFVNVSSFSVYGTLELPRGAVLDESCPLENASQERWDAYGFGKLKQDQIVMEYGRTRQLPYVILRPGAVFGPGKRGLTGRVGIDTFGCFLHLGGSNQLPLTYVDNCADAIVLAGLQPGVDGEVFNVVDDDLPTSRQLLRAYRQKVRRFRALPLPYVMTWGLSVLWEKYSRWSRGQIPPVFNRRRCSAEWKGNRYSNRKLKEKLGWQPRVPMKDAVQSFLAQFDQN
jgi:nucleoside-diphosphate-sugar epimerase